MKIKDKKIKNIGIMRALSLSAIALIVVAASIYAPAANSATLQQQIDSLAADSDKKEDRKDILGVEAGSLAEAVDKLQGEINASQAQINRFESQIDELKKQITEAEIELAKQKKVLGVSIRTMYVEGDISTVEMLATSKDLSDFFDKQQYRESVQNKIKVTLDKITELKLELNSKKEQVQKSLEAQQQLRNQLASQKAEKNRVLGLNQSQQQDLESKIKANSTKIAELRKQQIAANARFAGGGSMADSSGYPWANYRAGSWTHAGSCYYGDDIDDWGMCYRQCVSYVAWKVANSGRFMPHWGGRGNANLWDDNARGAGIPVNSTPAPGAVAVSNSGQWGHVMYVESVNGNGTINISQYNVGLDGKYSVRYNLSTSGLVFIHF